MNEKIKNIVDGHYTRPRSDKCASAATTSVLLVASMTGDASTGDQIETLCQHVSDETSAAVDWSTYAGRYHIQCQPDAEGRVREVLAHVLPQLYEALPPSKYRGHPKMMASWLSADGVLSQPVDCANGEKRTALLRLRRELETQDNACTADPIFLVQRRRMISGMDLEYADAIMWALKGYERLFFEGPAAEELGIDVQNLPPGQDLDDVLDDHQETRCVGIIWNWEYVSAHFTQRAAERFIEENSHRYRDELRVYVESQRRCPEWQTVIEFLLENLPRE